MKHPDSPVTFYERMQAGKAAKKERDAAVPEKRSFTPVRKPAAIPEHKGVLAPLVLPADTPAGKP